MTAFDPIALIEKGYEPQSDPQAWLEAMTREVVAPFDVENLGATGYFMGPNGPENMVWRPPPGGASSDEAWAVLSGGFGDATPEQMDAVLRAMLTPGMTTLVEHVGQLPERGRKMGSLTLVDSSGVVVNTGEGRVAVFAAVHARPPNIDLATRALWKRIAVHLGAGCRLAGRPADPDADDVEMVLSPDGKVAHATGEGKTEAAREEVRDVVAHMDRARSRAGKHDPFAALELWQGLVAGRWSLVDHFDRDGRRFLLARKNDPAVPQANALSRRQRQVVFYAAAGWSLTEIGYALGLAQTTVSTHLSTALRKLGLSSRNELVRLAAELLAGVPARAAGDSA